MEHSTWQQIDVYVGQDFERVPPAYEWHVNPAEGLLSLEDFKAGTDTLLGDGLRIATAWDEDHPIAGPTGPWSASFTVIAPTMEQLRELKVGLRVAMFVWQDWPYSTMDLPGYEGVIRPPLGYFLGRIAEVSSVRDEAGVMIATVMCADYMADLGELTVGYADRPQELIATRLGDWFRNVGVPVPDVYLWGQVSAREADPVSLLEGVMDLLAQCCSPYLGTPYGRYQDYLCINAEPIYNEDFTSYTLPLQPPAAKPYMTAANYKRAIHGNGESVQNLAGQLADVGGRLFTITIDTDDPDPDTHSVVLDASQIDLGVEWTRRKSTRVDRVTVTSTVDNVGRIFSELPGSVPVEYVQETDSPFPGDMEALALYLLPEGAEDGWGFDTITLRDWPLSIPDANWCNVFFAQSTLRQPVVVTGLTADQSPTGTDWIAFSVSNAAIEFSGGDFTMELTVRNDMPRSDGADWDNVIHRPEPYLSYRNLRGRNIVPAVADGSTTGWAVAGGATLGVTTGGYLSDQTMYFASNGAAAGAAYAYMNPRIAAEPGSWRASLMVRGQGSAQVLLYGQVNGASQILATSPTKPLTGSWQMIELAPVAAPAGTERLYLVVRQMSAGAFNLLFERPLITFPAKSEPRIKEIDRAVTYYDMRIVRRTDL